MPNTAVTIPEDQDIEVDFDAIDKKVAEGRAAESKPVEKTAPAEPEIVIEEVPPPRAAILKPEEGLEKLRQQLADEKQARIQAEQARQAAEQRAQEAATAEVQAKTEKQGTELEFFTTAIASLTQQTDSLEARYADAMAAQDYQAAAKAQREMATNAAKLQELESAKVRLERAPKPQMRQFTDPVEQFASKLSAPSAAWIRAHPEYVRDQAKNAELLAADQIARARGLALDSPEYFRSVERSLELSRPDPVTDDADPVAAAQATGGRRAAPASAPVSRAGHGTGSRPNVVRLTSEQVEMARNMDMKPEEYARHLQALQREGKLN